MNMFMTFSVEIRDLSLFSPCMVRVFKTHHFPNGWPTQWCTAERPCVAASGSARARSCAWTTGGFLGGLFLGQTLYIFGFLVISLEAINLDVIFL